MRVRVKHGSVLQGKRVFAVGDELDLSPEAVKSMDADGTMLEILPTLEAAPAAIEAPPPAPAVEAQADTNPAPKKRKRG